MLEITISSSVEEIKRAWNHRSNRNLLFASRSRRRSALKNIALPNRFSPLRGGKKRGSLTIARHVTRSRGGRNKSDRIWPDHCYFLAVKINLIDPCFLFQSNQIHSILVIFKYHSCPTYSLIRYFREEETWNIFSIMRSYLFWSMILLLLTLDTLRQYLWYFIIIKDISNVLIFFSFFLNFEETIMKRHFRFDLWMETWTPSVMAAIFRGLPRNCQ